MFLSKKNIFEKNNNKIRTKTKNIFFKFGFISNLIND